MALLAILLFALLCYPTLLFLRWLLGPIWPTGKETGRMQFFICDYFVLLAEIGTAMIVFGHPERHSEGELTLAPILWIAITLLWIFCCRALSLMRVTQTLPRLAGMLLIPMGIAVAFFHCGATVLLVIGGRMDMEFFFWWPLMMFVACLLFPAVADWIGASARTSTPSMHCKTQ